MQSTQIRQSFLDFFEKKKHRIFPSDKLIPSGDPTLLFTSAGMVQFKGYFLGEQERSFRRAASCQKCLRTTDIELVGKTSRHHTFFEMLGNFSFGDYFKEEAVLWAWEFLINHLKIPKERLWVSVFKEDEETAKIWENKIGISKERIVPLDKEDNFWAMADTGPCGPCSEIIFDRGKDKGCGKPECRVGCDCDRFLEIWNLVFTQYSRQKDGRLVNLPQKNIDTGMGLERLAALLQGVDSNFETDLIKPLINEVEELTDFSYQKDFVKDISFRVIADHIRAVTFLNIEGVYFSNIGRGYIARRLLRRAVRQGRLLGIKEPFLYRLVGVVGEIFKSIYPEIRQFREELSRQILKEEKRFNETLNMGLDELAGIIQELKSKGAKILNGEVVFKLYDSFGFPVEMTEEISNAEGLEIDKPGFELFKERHRERARRSWKREKNLPAKVMVKGLSPTEFLGYEKLEVSAIIEALFKNGERCNSAEAGEEIVLILDRTSFYAEAGGQTNDTGFIQGRSFSMEISRVLKNSQGQIIHRGRIQNGKVKINDKVEAKVNRERRQGITHSHTATHLLQAALRTLIDKHIHQAGSWVGPDEFRFDFNYFERLSPEQVISVEDWVNARIRENIPLKISWKDKEDALRDGAIALFGEKYDQKVRVVDVSPYSSELCAGTHVKGTGEIKIFKIINEVSVAGGIRRIEAVMGQTGLNRLREESRILKQSAKLLGTTIEGVPGEIERLIQQIKNIEKQQKRKDELLPDLKLLLKEIKVINGLKILKKRFDGINRQALLLLIDKLRPQFDSGIIVFLSRHPDKIELVTSVSPDLVKKGYKADKLAKEISKLLGGSGGGRPDLGQGGGHDFNQIDKALNEIEKILSR